MKKVLVTGGAGFIANKVVSLLLDKGVEVVVVDNLNDYYDRSLKLRRLSELQGRSGFVFIEGDIEDSLLLKKVFEENTFDVVFNLAARAGVRYSMENPHIYMATNAIGSLNLLEKMRIYGVKKFVLASTSSLYAGQSMPFTEELAVNTPISPYAASKKAAEVMAYSYHYLYGIDVSIVRYFTVFGPSGRPDMSIFRFIKWIDEEQPIEVFGDGEQSRDFTYVDDIARGTIAAAKEVGYEIINLGGGQNPISLNEVINGIEKRLGKKAKREVRSFHKADIKETWADISKAKELLDWSPSFSFEEGLTRTVEWYIENRAWLKDIKL